MRTVTVKNVSGHAVDLSDGRTIGVGDFADNVNPADAHNKHLLDTEQIRVAVGTPEPPADTGASNVEEPPAAAGAEKDRPSSSTRTRGRTTS